jgi:diphosphomevalonate decarboxylase
MLLIYFINMKATAKAHSNIALIKYWGKRDEELVLPHNSSISFTIDKFHTITTVEFSKKYKKDILIINDKEYSHDSSEYIEYVAKFLDTVRNISDNKLHVKIVSNNNFPKGAGLASSASAFAALAIAIDSALSLKLSKKELSILARIGSGSASRSIHGGIVKWHKGQSEHGEDSFAEQLHDQNHWQEIKIIFCITDTSEKKIKSRVGMKRTVETSPKYVEWLETVDDDIDKIELALTHKDFTLLGKTAEKNCLKMHNTMHTSKPPIIYQNPTTLIIMKKVRELRHKGIECYFTMDAGPQVKIITQDKNVKLIEDEIKKLNDVQIIVSGIGPDAKIIDEHLF